MGVSRTLIITSTQDTQRLLHEEKGGKAQEDSQPKHISSDYELEVDLI
jgi:hypothetical protein